MLNRNWRRAVILAGIGILTNAFQALGQATAGAYKDSRDLPDTPAARRLTDLLGVLKSGDRERTRTFISEDFNAEFRDARPMEEHLNVFSDFRETAQNFEFYGVRRYDPPRPETQVVAIFRNRLTESWQAIVLEVESNPPHRIAGLQFAPARPPSDLPPPAKLSDAEVVTKLGEFLERLAASDAFSGTVLLAKDGQVLFKKAYGPACKSYNVPNNTETKFNLGSMNKMFTAVAITQLVERGKLSFTDPISKYLGPEWLPSDVTDKVTIEHLLSHTSGLGSYFNDKFMKSSRTLYRTVDDYRPLVAEERLEFEPGTKWSYSNTGFLLLGAIIEKVTGQTYFDYVRENIFKPAGMTNTDSYDMDEPVPNLAVGYAKNTGENGHLRWRTNLFEHTIKGGPAGGGFSTVDDLLKFDIALRSHKLLNAETTQILWSPKPSSPDYGYGFGVRIVGENLMVGHSGGFIGISANFDMHLTTGYTVVVLSNYGDAAGVVTRKMNEMLGASP